MRIAITRGLSASIASCELTYQSRKPIDVDRARRQHSDYEECLRSLGCEVHRLPEAPELPDAVFVEDIAVVLDEVAVITRPGAESRRPEIPAVAESLRPYRPLARIEAPGILDGGDILRLGQRLFVGLSRRSNGAAIRQLQDLLAVFGYGVTGVPVRDCLHLKSAVTQVAEEWLLVNPDWVDAARFGSIGIIEVDRNEPYAANALMISDRVIFPSAYPATRGRLEDQGIKVTEVDASELAKAEGAVTCCSLIFSP